MRTKGIVEAGRLSCAGCHTRDMSPGAVFEGAQGSVGSGPFCRGSSVGDGTPETFQRWLDRDWALFGAPWIIPKARDDKEVANFEVPLAQRDRSPR